MNFSRLEENDLIAMNCKIKNKSEAEKKDYINKYYLYRKLFTEYIINKLDLKEYEKRIENSNLNIRPNAINEIDNYQDFSFNELKYFYVRNNIYLENLTQEEEEFLNEKIDNNDDKLDEKSIQMIEKSYRKIISNSNKPAKVFYGPLSRSFMASNDDVVIGFRYDEFHNDNMNDLQWKSLHDKQVIFLTDIMKEIYKKMDNMTIIQYSKYSIIPRKK